MRATGTLVKDHRDSPELMRNAENRGSGGPKSRRQAARGGPGAILGRLQVPPLPPPGAGGYGWAFLRRSLANRRRDHGRTD